MTRELSTQIALIQQSLDRHIRESNEHRDIVTERLEEISHIAKDYYGDPNADRIGVAKMARRAYAGIKWMIGLGLASGGGTALVNSNAVASTLKGIVQ